MGRVYLRGGVWWISYYHAGKEQREPGSRKKAAAVKLLKRRHEELGKGRSLREAEKVLLTDLKALIEADYKINDRRSGKRLTQSWAHLVEFFGKDERAINITAPRLALYLTRRSDEGARPATIKNELAALKRAFNLARKSGTLLPNEVPAAFPTIAPSAARQGFFEREQHEAVKAALSSDVAAVAEFMFWSGWRRGEALGLRWSNVDMGAGIIRIETSKNREARTLPFAALPILAELIAERRAVTDVVQQQRGMIVSHVFHRNGAPIHHFRRSWITACRKAGCPGRIPHDYRRSAARNLSRAGVPEPVIMQLCGWKTRSVFDRYRIVAERELAEGLARLATFEHTTMPSSARVSPLRART
jgi:integrase